MIKKLLLILVAFISFNGFSQATANPVGDILQCNNEVFDLTVQTGPVLGNQNPAVFTVGYFTTMANALANTNPIANPTSYVAPMVQAIYIRVTNTQDATFATTSFMVSWSSWTPMGPFPDVTACDSYVLPALPAGQNYFTLPGGGGNIIPPGMMITSTLEIFVWSDNFCSTGDSFMVTILPTPIAPSFDDVVVCDFYSLPALAQGNYYTGPNGSGNIIPVGQAITTSQTIYIWVSNGMCSDESSFDVTVISSPMQNFSNSYACTAYALPDLPAGYQYMLNGVLIPEGTVITETTTMSIYGESNTAPNCTSIQEFTINIGTPEIVLDNLQGCDYNNDGIAEFSLVPENVGDFSNSYAMITFHESFSDASNSQNPIFSSYVNMTPFQQMIYVRIELSDGCFTVSELLLVVIECSNSTISGTVHLDTNNDGCNATDPVFTNAQVSLTNGNTVMYSYLNALGQYSFFGVPQGNNYIAINNLPAYFTAPAAQLVVTTGNTDSDVANFCVVGPAPVNDAQLTLSSWMTPVPGFQMGYVMSIQNIGTTVLSGSATFTYDNAMLSFSNASPAQASQTVNTITFNYSNLAPSAYVNYQLNFMVFIPPTVQSGDILDASAITTTDQFDSNLTNNSMAMTHTVVNSYDPNDISVHEGPFITEDQADGYLHYTIRFQNSGTAPAVNVRLENTLDPNLDWSTLMPLAASHTYTAERNGGDLTFRFNNIMLPAEQDDEPGSHGWITYKVKPVADFAIGDVISNVAGIYFDFNPAIITNTVTTQIQQLAVADHDFTSLKLYPNPASTSVNFAGFDGVLQVQVYDVQGKLIKSATLNQNQPLDVSDIESGMYFVKIAAEGQLVTKKLIVE